MTPAAFIVVLAAFLIQTYSVTGETSQGQGVARAQQWASTAKGVRDVTIDVPKKETKKRSPFAIPTKEEIRQQIRDDGFVVASFKHTKLLFLGIMLSPYRNLIKICAMVVTIGKLAAESVRQTIHPPAKKLQ